MDILSRLQTTFLTPIGPAAIDARRRALLLGGVNAQCGFPSPAEDFQTDTVDLNELLIRNEPATFFYRASGESMLLAGVCDGDLLAVDRSVNAHDGDLVLAIWDGNVPVCKILRLFGDHVELHSANPRHAPIVLPPGTEVEVYAIVGVVRQIVRRRSHVRFG